MRASPYERSLMAKLVRKGNPINLVAEWLGFHRNTVSYWSKQDLRTRFDLPRNQKGKITVEVEISILYMRTTYGWGTARIQQGLINLPDYMLKEMEVIIQGFSLSRQAINTVLRKHQINGYRRKSKSWKFFRAKESNELWQLDIKGPFKVEGKKYWILACIDDYSRYFLLLKLFDHAPTVKEIGSSLLLLVKKHRPKNILTDNNPFKKDWKKWCNEHKTKALFAHPYYPQDKGKIERAIRNLAEEFINILKKFPQWLKGKLEKWRIWYNNKRFHRGIKDYPANLYA